jgi:hypothetical protein
MLLHPPTTIRMFALIRPICGSIGQSDTGESHPSRCPIGQIGITPLVRCRDRHIFSRGKRI